MSTVLKSFMVIIIFKKKLFLASNYFDHFVIIFLQEEVAVTTTSTYLKENQPTTLFLASDYLATDRTSIPTYLHLLFVDKLDIVT